MSNSSTSLVQPEVLNDNKMTINSFLKQSYNSAKQHIEDGVSMLQDSVSFIKDEFTNLYDKTGQYINKMALPVNNFLKDHSQIEEELQQEEFRSACESMSASRIIPIEIALLSPMEENY